MFEWVGGASPQKSPSQILSLRKTNSCLQHNVDDTLLRRVEALIL